MSLPTGINGIDSENPTRRAASADALPLPALSETLARRVEQLIAASESAAHSIAQKAQADADDLIRAATQAGIAQGQRAAAAVAGDPAAPQLEESVSELRAMVKELRADVDRLNADLTLLAGTVQPSLPPPAQDQPRAQDERRAMLIAINMASNGASRAEAASYLAEHLAVPDPESLLDAVYGYVAPHGEDSGDGPPGGA